MPEDFQRRVVVELDPGLDAEGHRSFGSTSAKKKYVRRSS
jgi:hypothetical protein